MAAGFSLEEDKIEEFRNFAGEYVNARIGGEEIVPGIELDGVLDAAGATVELAEQLEQLEPFGAGNPEPKLMLSGVRAVRASLVGSGHVRCFLTSDNGGNIKAMAFRSADTEVGKALLNGKGDKFDVVGVLRRDNWQGRNSVQFIIDDIRKSR